MTVLSTAEDSSWEVVCDLSSLILRLSLARGVAEVMDIVRSDVRRLLGADGVTFVLRDGDSCFYADEDAISPLWKGQRFPAETCISGWAMIHRQPAVIEDIYRDPRIPVDAYRLTFVRSLVMVPVGRDNPVAAIGTYWATKRRASQAEVERLELIADAAAAALATAALCDSLRAAAAEAHQQATFAERRAQESAQAKLELELVVEQKSRLVAAFSHDLRQPLQAIRLMQAVLANRVSEGNREIVQRLGQAIRQGEDLLEHLLAASRDGSGLPPAIWDSFALSELFDRLRITFGGPAHEKALQLRILATDHWVKSDPILLARILGNYISNAIKYTDAGGILLGARRRQDDVLIEVWDTGIGISSEHLDKVFLDFYQVDNPQRDSRFGIGLGLGIVRHLAQHLGHEVSVRSVEGRGSVFSVRVPIAREATAPARGIGL
jgi:two-component system CheB/CheR fusion protein